MAIVKAWQTRFLAFISKPDVDANLITSEAMPELNAYWELKSTLMPRFYQPADPVVLISGLGSSFDIAENAEPDSVLPCRFMSQMVSSLTVKSTSITISLISGAKDLALPDNKHLPGILNALVGSLSYEALFLNPGSAPLLANVGKVTENEVILAMEKQTDYLNSGGDVAVMPYDLAIQQWQQAWMPLYLDWELNWHAMEAATSIQSENGWTNWYFDQKAWRFNGLDYDFAGALPVSRYAFRYNSNGQNFTLQTGNENLFFNSLIDNNHLVDENGNSYPISSAVFADGTLTIQLQNNPVAKDITCEFQYTVGRETYSLVEAVSKNTFVIPVTYDEYVRFQAAYQSIFVYHSQSVYDTCTIASTDYDLNSQTLTITVSGTISDSYAAGDPLRLIITYGPAAFMSGRTFVTPEATFNFRNRLQQYIYEHSGEENAEHLQEVEHLLDIIGGRSYPIVSAGVDGNQFVVESEINLDHLFPVNSICYVSQSPGENNGAYRVSATPTQDAGYVTIQVKETVKNSPTGVLTPAPHQWDLMSQTLSGFTDQLIMRSLDASVSPGGPPAIHTASGGGNGGKSYPVTDFTPPPDNFSYTATFQVDVDSDISGQYKKDTSFTIGKGDNCNLQGTYICSSDATYSGHTLTLSFDTRLISQLPAFPIYKGCMLNTGKSQPSGPVYTSADFSTPPWYPLTSTGAAPHTFCFASTTDVGYLFPSGQPCYFADGDSTPPYAVTGYHVGSASFSNGVMTITVLESFTGNPSGFLGPDMNALMAGHREGYPMIDTANNSSMEAAAYFFPIRGGFFEFRRLQIVDRFGQVVDLLFANQNAASMATKQAIDNAWETFAPIKGRWLIPAPDSSMPDPFNRLSQLGPRMVAPARLDFCFVDGSGGTNDKIDIDLIPDPEPVCGWLLPNPMDNGVSVYDRDGKMSGELLLSVSPNEPAEVLWYPAGGMNTVSLADLTEKEIANPYLRGMLKGLSLRPEGSVGQAFQNFLQAIDETLWSITDSSTLSEQHLALLLGRPLAVVRSRLQFTIRGHASYNQLSSYYTDTYTFNSWTATRATESSNAFFTITDTTGSSADGVEALAAQFVPQKTLSVSGDTVNAGVYRIINATGTFNNPGYTIQVNVQGDIPSDNAGGVLRLNPPAGSVSELSWDVRLGRSDLYDDGLIGYFVDGDQYARFNSVHTPEDINHVGYLNPIGGEEQNYLSLPFHPETGHGSPGADIPLAAPARESVYITMLMDPRASVHATTGLLPTKQLTLPASFIQGVMENMAVTFRVGPILTDPDKIQMPLPYDSRGEWGWQQVQSGTDSIVSKDVAQSGRTAQLPATPLILQDGWLALTGPGRDRDENDP